MSQFYAGQKFAAGPGVSTVLPDFDFETYSEAGYRWDEATQKWSDPLDAPNNKRGLKLVGTVAYAEHPTTEPLLLRWDLKDGRGPRRWAKGDAPPVELFEHIARGGLIEAWNDSFEFEIWNRCCVPKLGWPPLPLEQMRCAMAKARSFGLPGKLELAADVGLQLPAHLQKFPGGSTLIKKFSMPRNPTKKDPRKRIELHEDAVDGPRYDQYNAQDIVAEEAVSVRCPDMPIEELLFWQLDHRINVLGVAMDEQAVTNAITIIHGIREKLNAELLYLTGGAVSEASKGAQIISWLAAWRVYTDSIDEESIETLLKREDIQPHVRRVLEIRQSIASAAVAKLFSINHQLSKAGRLHWLFAFFAARTGRFTGNGPQPQNLPSSGPDVYWCKCGACTTQASIWCPACGSLVDLSDKESEWSHEAAEFALRVINTGSVETAERFFGNKVTAVVASSLRSMFIAAPGKDLIASDFSAIEAVVLACLAGEEWRIDVFRSHGRIYEMSASKITGTPFEHYVAYREQNGKYHPDRKKIGKIAELASGYRGWVNAWIQFGADEFFNEQEIKKHILAWREASPWIVEFWGGQYRGLPWDDDRYPELYGIEGAAVSAIKNPGSAFGYRDIQFQMQDDALYMRLPSGRYLTYHRPRLHPQTDDKGRDMGLQISFEGYNTNPKAGAIGWVRMYTHGGKLTENIVQAGARDILRHAMVNLDAAGYPIVLHVHDEIVAEVFEGWGSVEEFERIAIANPPAWWAHWPVRITGGWRGKRFRK